MVHGRKHVSNENCALVTGGTRGIGASIVQRLARAGGRVVFCGRNPQSVNKVETELRLEGLDVHGLVADVRQLGDIEQLVERTLELAAGDGIRVLVNNAGRSGGGPTVKIADELWYDVIETNLNAVFRLTREVLRKGGMLERGYGRVINIASTGGKQGVAFGAPYSASKHAVVGFSKALGLELAKSGVTVNAVCPGFVETELAEHVRQGFAALWNVSVEDAKQRIEQRIPIGRYVKPAEVAELVAYLASPLQSSITAQAINVCGGLGNY
jgi:ketoreductase